MVNKNGEAQIQFNTVSIRSVSSSTSVTSEPNEILAFEFSPEMAHLYDLYLINSDINQSVRYEFSLISKYQMISIITSSSGAAQLGDPDIGEAANVTLHSNLFSTSVYSNRIFLINFYFVENFIGDSQESFETDYTVLLELLDDGSYLNYMSNEGDYILSNTMTSSRTLQVNREITTSDAQVFGIPISQESNYLYNVTIRFIGNYTNSDYNITRNSTPVVSGGIVFDTKVYSDLINSYDFDGYSSYSFVYLQLSSVSYLFVDIAKVGGRNGSIEIAVNRIHTAKLDLDIPDINELRWSEDRVNGEYKHSEKLLKEVAAPEHKSDAPLDFLSVGIGLGIVAVIISIRRRKGR